jgi:hypothetical protein
MPGRRPASRPVAGPESVPGLPLSIPGVPESVPGMTASTVYSPRAVQPRRGSGSRLAGPLASTKIPCAPAKVVVSKVIAHSTRRSSGPTGIARERAQSRAP